MSKPCNTDFLSCDPFQEEEPEISKIHVRIFSRSNNKKITTIEGLSQNIPLKTLTKTLSSLFECSAIVVDDEERGKIITLKGDQRMNVVQYMLRENIVRRDQIVCPGLDLSEPQPDE